MAGCCSDIRSNTLYIATHPTIIHILLSNHITVHLINMHTYLLNVDWKVNILVVTFPCLRFLLIINPIMQIDTTHNPVIQLVETTAIIIAAESSVVLTVGLRVITVVGVG